jgi:hypothetical protein
MSMMLVSTLFETTIVVLIDARHASVIPIRCLR